MCRCGTTTSTLCTGRRSTHLCSLAGSGRSPHRGRRGRPAGGRPGARRDIRWSAPRSRSVAESASEAGRAASAMIRSRSAGEKRRCFPRNVHGTRRWAARRRSQDSRTWSSSAAWAGVNTAGVDAGPVWPLPAAAASARVSVYPIRFASCIVRPEDRQVSDAVGPPPVRGFDEPLGLVVGSGVAAVCLVPVVGNRVGPANRGADGSRPAWRPALRPVRSLSSMLLMGCCPPYAPASCC